MRLIVLDMIREEIQREFPNTSSSILKVIDSLPVIVVNPTDAKLEDENASQQLFGIYGSSTKGPREGLR